MVLAGIGGILLLLMPGGGVAPGSPTHAAAPRFVAPTTVITFPTTIQHVVVIALENRELGQVVGIAPFQTYLYRHFARVPHFYAYCHGILDYLSVTSGTTRGCGVSTYRTYNLSSLANSAAKSGESWIAYDQDMPAACATNDSGSYLVRHNPFVWYAPVVNHTKVCTPHDVPLGNWTPAAGYLRNYTFVTPNVTNDCHSAKEAVCDAWLRGFLGPVLNDTVRMATTAFFVWYDEGTTNAGYSANITGGRTYLVAVCGLCVGNLNNANSTDFNVITTTEWLLGLPSLGHADNSTVYLPLRSLF